MTIKSRLCDILKLTTPIFQAPSWSNYTQLASAVANNCGLGMVPLGNWPIENCERLIDETLNLTNQNIGVNLILE